jgi:hypothetical protein
MLLIWQNGAGNPGWIACTVLPYIICHLFPDVQLEIVGDDSPQLKPGASRCRAPRFVVPKRFEVC